MEANVGGRKRRSFIANATFTSDSKNQSINPQVALMSRKLISNRCYLLTCSTMNGTLSEPSLSAWPLPGCLTLFACPALSSFQLAVQF